MRIQRFVGKKSPIEDEARPQHGAQIFFQVGKKRFQAGAGENFPAGFQYLFAHAGFIGIIPCLAEKDLLELDLGAVPARLAVLLAQHHQVQFVGQWAQQFAQQVLHFFELRPVLLASGKFHVFQFTFKIFQHFIDRTASGGDRPGFGSDLFRVTAIELFQHQAAVFTGGAKEKSAQTAGKYGAEQQQQR